MRVLKLFGLGVTLVILALAAGNSEETGLSQEESWIIGEDALFAAIAKVIRGFGGLFFDEWGHLNVYLLDPPPKGEISEVHRFFYNLRDELELPITSSKDIVILQGQYDFLQLKEWADKAMDLLSLHGVVSLDIDEGRNKLSIGVLDDHARAVVKHQLDALGIPEEAVIVEVRPPDILLTGTTLKKETLQDKVRPVMGGVQICSATGKHISNLGFNAYLPDTVLPPTEYYFVTCSHCTDIPGAVGTTFGQPWAWQTIGEEVKDPAYFTGGKCPQGRRCRYSDSALVKYINKDDADFPSIAWAGTLYCKGDSIEINGRMVVVRRRCWVYKGLEVQKVGSRTGWTCGPVTETCVKVKAFTLEDGTPKDTGITFLCQAGAFLHSDLGDSGAPVFTHLRETEYGLPGVDIVGILSSSNGEVTHFSPMGWIDWELGPLVVGWEDKSCFWRTLSPGQSIQQALSPGQSIQQAIDAAREGDTIYLGEGTWNENIEIKKSLTLRGQGPRTVITGAKGGYPVILIKSYSKIIKVRIEGLTITGAKGDKCAVEAPQWSCSDGLLVLGSAQVTVTNSTISENEEDGIYVWGSAQVTVTNSTISDNEEHGIYVEDSGQVTVTNSTVSENEEVGIAVGDSAQVTVTNSTISNNGLGGLNGWYSAQVTVTNSTISDNVWGDGIKVWGGAQVTVTNSTISDNWDGIEMWGSARARIIGNTIRDNCAYGISAESPDNIVECRGNTVINNGRIGMGTGNFNKAAAQKCK